MVLRLRTVPRFGVQVLTSGARICGLVLTRHGGV